MQLNFDSLHYLVFFQLSATGQGYSIQNANALGFTPPGFAGHIIYPNSIFLSDLLVRFDHTITDFSIMYACQELGCDDAATMKVTAFMNGIYVGFNTRTATFPGTWPVDTLRCSFPQGFDSVVVHYYLHPPTCQDYGTIFVADNMRVTPISTSVISEGELPVMFTLSQNYPNPFNPKTKIDFQISNDAKVTMKIYDITGREVATLINNELKKADYYSIDFNPINLASGIYFYRIIADKFIETKKMMFIK
ncbi:MAG: T9SS type A sorting domain-containing protein [Ignavibacteriae bacterium]|nr:T9SS type A sorting domain-containing protein [Ignavibacteriota bacterium]